MTELHRDLTVGEVAARSGVNLSRLLIAAEPTIRKSIAPIMMMMSGGKGGAPQIAVWEFTDRVMGAFNGLEGTESFKSMGGFDMTQGKNLGMTGANFEISVVDEDTVDAGIPDHTPFPFPVPEGGRTAPASELRDEEAVLGAAGPGEDQKPSLIRIRHQG